MENKMKFKCQCCELTFPVSELLPINHINYEEDICRMCQAQTDYDEADGDYKVMEVAADLKRDIYFERLELNLQFGIKE